MGHSRRFCHTYEMSAIQLISDRPVRRCEFGTAPAVGSLRGFFRYGFARWPSGRGLIRARWAYRLRIGYFGLSEDRWALDILWIARLRIFATKCGGGSGCESRPRQEILYRDRNGRRFDRDTQAYRHYGRRQLRSGGAGRGNRLLCLFLRSALVAICRQGLGPPDCARGARQKSCRQHGHPGPCPDCFSGHTSGVSGPPNYMVR
jgi:hypothetical protein